LFLTVYGPHSTFLVAGLGCLDGLFQFTGTPLGPPVRRSLSDFSLRCLVMAGMSWWEAGPQFGQWVRGRKHAVSVFFLGSWRLGVGCYFPLLVVPDFSLGRRLGGLSLTLSPLWGSPFCLSFLAVRPVVLVFPCRRCALRRIVSHAPFFMRTWGGMACRFRFLVFNLHYAVAALGLGSVDGLAPAFFYPELFSCTRTFLMCGHATPLRCCDLAILAGPCFLAAFRHF